MHDVTFDLGDDAAFATSMMKRGEGGVGEDTGCMT
jgi:hypothetical protein